MMKLLVSVLCALCILTLGNNLFAQPDSTFLKLAGFVQNVNTFNHVYPQEKVYLHFDNTGYFTGENIWFKAYVVTSELNRPTALSRVLYVELLSPEGDILETKKLKIENGCCCGDFFLKENLYGGFYEVRAYTRVMLNFGNEVVFSRVFPVFDQPRKPGDYLKKNMTARPSSQRVPFVREKGEDLKKLNVTFYPEGGSLATGLPARVAFRITDKNGAGVQATGYLYDDRNEVVSTFQSLYQGMGSFDFIPDGKKHTAVFEYDGKRQSFDLPVETTAGYVLRVENMRKDMLMIQVQKSVNRLSETIGLAVSCRGKVYIFDTLSVNADEGFLMKVPKAALPSGVNQVTLFAASGEVLGERLVFIHNETEAVFLKVSTNKETYQPYEKIYLDLQAADQEGKPAQTNFSLAVRDWTSETGTWQDNIRTNLLLSSELKGFIDNPEYYFESSDNAHRMALDLLMLTQGWRRYSWKQMSGQAPFTVQHRIEEGIVIDGQVLSVFRKKKQDKIDVDFWLYPENDPMQQGNCPTDEEGRFNFLPADFNGTANLLLKTSQNDKAKENRILLNRIFAPPARAFSFFDTRILEPADAPQQYPSVTNPTAETTEDSLGLTEMTENSHLLQEVTVKGKKTFKKEDEGLAVATIVYDVGKTISDLDDQGKDYSEDVASYLLSMNRYFSQKAGMKADLSSTDLLYKGKPVLFVVDNMQICTSSWGELHNIFVSDIETMIISETPNLYMRYCGGLGTYCESCDELSPETRVIFLYTYKNRMPNMRQKGVRRTRLEGFSYVEEFFSPQYAGMALPDEKDVRRTLYWNPDITTDDEGKVNVEFYNNASCRKVVISAEGLTPSGLPVILE